MKKICICTTVSITMKTFVVETANMKTADMTLL